MSNLHLREIGKTYGRKTIFDAVTTDVPIGLTLLTGPSGAGKSTLLRILATGEKPSRGELTWKGVRLPAARNQLRRALGYAPQSVDLPEDLTAREFAMHMAALKGLDLGAADLQFGAIAQSINLHADINQRIAAFSGGMRRRLVFAQALLGDPELIILDEPTSELDRDTAALVETLIVERAATASVIITTHGSDRLAAIAAASWKVEGGQVT
jgi:ABC-2 type transport system ATP-binding protein